MSSPSIQATHYLRVEGVNLSAFVFDTRDLSTTRGGSLLLLDAVPEAEKALKGCSVVGKVEVIRQGASSGLFAIETANPAAAAKAVREALGKDKNWKHATFVVDVVAAGDFAANREQVLAANRWRQMQASSLAVPAASSSASWSQPACDLDGLRAAETGNGDTHNLRGRDLSDSTWRRREYGRTQKQLFYEKWTGVTGLDYAEHFEEICKGCKPLDGKLAVFYADGNNFGKNQVELCTDNDKQKAFDTYIRGKRQQFLTAFLNDAKGRKEWLLDRNGKNGEGDAPILRFETLLWGGDEVMFVMPAALGWRFAAFFFGKMAGLNLKDAGAGLPDAPLSHAAALVFCQHHSPIHRIKRLAQEQMAEFAKRTDRQRDSLVVVALESFDHLGTGFEDAMNRRYRGIVPLSNLILADPGKANLGTHLKTIATHFDSLRGSETFPRSQLRGLVNAMLASRDKTAAATLAAFAGDKAAGKLLPPKHFRNATGEEKELLRGALLPLFGNDPATLWLQLEELWDYALPAPEWFSAVPAAQP